MALDYLKTETLDEILAAEGTKQIKAVVVHGHRFSLRQRGKEFGYIDRRKTEIRWKETSYVSSDEAHAKEIHQKVSLFLGITHE